MLTGNPQRALQYLIQGANLLTQPGLRRFVVVPLLVNIVVFIFVTGVLVNTYGDILHNELMDSNWLRFFAVLIWLIIGLVILVLYGYAFNLITTVIAAPFYGVLAEKIETSITGQSLPSEPLVQLITRTFRRELIKLWYFLSRGILIFFAMIVLFFIPILGGMASLVIGSLWGAWCMTVQYSDYAADNHQVAFRSVRRKLHEKPLTTFSFGGLVMLGSMVPILNIIVMPIAVAGATIYWLDENKKPKV